MKEPRNKSTPDARSHLKNENTSRSNWVRLSEIDSQSLRDLVSRAPTSKERRVFAIVRSGEQSKVSSTRVQRVLVFDDHPDSLSLVFGSPITSEPSVTSSGPWRAFQVLLLVSLLCHLVTAIVAAARFSLRTLP